MGAPKRKLPAALAANIWKPGQSGNPAGHSGLYGTAIKLAQRSQHERVNHTDPRPLQAHPLKADDPTSLEPDQGPSASSLQQTPSRAATCCACISSCPIRAISSLLASLAELFR